MNPFLQLHLLTIVPVLVLGPFILLSKKGDKAHMILGRLWAYLMVVSCLFTFGIMPFSWLHILSIFTLWQVIKAILAVKRKDLKTHQRAMVGSYLGALVAFVIAASSSNRLIGGWIYSLFN